LGQIITWVLVGIIIISVLNRILDGIIQVLNFLIILEPHNNIFHHFLFLEILRSDGIVPGVRMDTNAVLLPRTVIERLGKHPETEPFPSSLVGP
jgi:hypothetical protein